MSHGPLTGNRRHRPPVPNEQRLGYWVERALHGYRALLDEVLRELGIAPGQESLLTDIRLQELARPQQWFARRLGVQRPTVTRSLARLERAGLIERRQLRDPRQRRIMLSADGLTVMRVLATALHNVEADLAERLDPATLDALRAGLPAFCEAAAQVLEERRTAPPPLPERCDYSPVMMNSGMPLKSS